MKITKIHIRNKSKRRQKGGRWNNKKPKDKVDVNLDVNVGIKVDVNLSSVTEKKKQHRVRSKLLGRVACGLFFWFCVEDED